MKDKYYLALADEVDFDNRDKVKKSVIELIVLEIVLQICYQLYPFLLRLANKNRIVAVAILIAFLAVFAGVANYY